MGQISYREIMNENNWNFFKKIYFNIKLKRFIGKPWGHSIIILHNLHEKKREKAEKQILFKRLKISFESVGGKFCYFFFKFNNTLKPLVHFFSHSLWFLCTFIGINVFKQKDNKISFQVIPREDCPWIIKYVFSLLKFCLENR